MRALAGAPLARVRGRSPAAMFSLLRPTTRIPPHNGFVNTRLICHLPLIVPESCGLRVGNEVRTPAEGKAWVFDDTIEHEAWNGSAETRVILLFEIWRPELSDAERDLVSAMFEAIDQHSGQATAWEI
jgi:aspartyl/asparaginyl beta-hydroxylase (cupin superfamily)